MEQFAADEGAKRLYLLTCCASKAIGCCPINYQQKGLTTPEEWDTLCSKATEIGEGTASATVATAQEALQRINSIRIERIQQKGLEAELVHIPGTIMNQMIVIRKKE